MALFALDEVMGLGSFDGVIVFVNGAIVQVFTRFTIRF